MKDFYALGMWKCGRLGDQSCLVSFGQPNSPETFVKFQKLLQNAFLLGPLFGTFQKRCLEKKWISGNYMEIEFGWKEGVSALVSLSGGQIVVKMYYNVA